MQNSPTVCQVLPSLISGGVERGTLEIAKALEDKGWGSLVASSGGPMTHALERMGSTHLSLPLHRKHLPTMWKNIGALEVFFREKEVSLVHARSRAPAWSAYYAARRCNIPFVTTFHGRYNTLGLGKKTYNSVMTRGAKVIAISEFIRDHILSTYPNCPAERIEVIYRGADLKQFNAEALRSGILANLAQEWHLADETRPIILLPGRLNQSKGQKELIRALAKIRDREFLALLVGKDDQHTEYRRELEQLIRHKGLEDRVRFLPSTNYMAEAYALSDMVVAPAIQPEAFGRVAVEAQAMGRIIIATDHGGVRETVLNGQTGLLVSPGDIDALARAILNVLNMPAERRAQIGRSGIEHVRAKFSILRMQQKTLALYESLL